MSETNNNIDNTFLPRRRAQLFVGLYIQYGAEAAEEWAVKTIPSEEERFAIRPYLIKEFSKRGYDYKDNGAA